MFGGVSGRDLASRISGIKSEYIPFLVCRNLSSNISGCVMYIA